MQRFFVSASLLEANELELPAEAGRQLTRVLRARSGERIALFCGDGWECEAIIEVAPGGRVTARILERRQPEVELGCRLEVAVAVLKGEKLDLVVQKLTEMGVASIRFLQTERTIVEAGADRWARRLQRYERIAREASEQSGRVRLPEIHEPVALPKLLSGERPRTFVLDPHGSRHLLVTLTPCPDQVLLLIGPEGGFTDTEVRLVQDAGAVPASIGPTILRAETAAIAAAAIAAAASESGAPHTPTLPHSHTSR
jgi:16S rRNA (uracil1498-N3)-methyltransferase